MSQYLCSSIQTKNYLIPNKEMSSSHPIFWSQRRPFSDQSISWSYPPKNNICAKVLEQISEKIYSFGANYTTGAFVKPLKESENPLINKMSTKLINRFAPDLCRITALDMSSALSVSLGHSSSMADRTAFSFDDKFSDSNVKVDNISVDSDSSSNERTNKIQINDSKVLDSMQIDRQKKKKRKRRRRKKKISTKPSTDETTKTCFECRNEFISFLFETNSDYDINEELTDTDLSSNEELIFEQIGADLQQLCGNFYVDYLFHHNSNLNNSDNTMDMNSGFDEVDCCPQFRSDISTSVESKTGEDESEMTAINESIRRANENWNQNYCNVSDDERKAVKVNFSSDKPSVRVLHVWDFAHRRARCGQWEELARDRQRFTEKCRRINSQIGYIFDSEHRIKAYNSRFNSNNSENI